ncbi:MAG: hypothetical protein EZS28_011372 [Streblomastix strix]|uniref:Uncharacterized protein n=1 Tax=Streblomastix strix TaxID=222440 RepID=A0A5J4WEZ8_9EUKA|nr:MAG: hypothetical protein EZS28_011372 [Streblomastix strix]
MHQSIDHVLLVSQVHMLQVVQIMEFGVFVNVVIKYPKLFGGEKIIHINSNVWDEYVTGTEHIIITRGMYKEHKEFVAELTLPQYVMHLPLDMSELKTLILTKNTYYTALNEDGNILSFRYKDGVIRDAKDFVSQFVNAEGNGEGLKTKHYQKVSTHFIFLFE